MHQQTKSGRERDRIEVSIALSPVKLHFYGAERNRNLSSNEYFYCTLLCETGRLRALKYTNETRCLVKNTFVVNLCVNRQK